MQLHKQCLKCWKVIKMPIDCDKEKLFYDCLGNQLHLGDYVTTRESQHGTIVGFADEKYHKHKKEHWYIAVKIRETDTIRKFFIDNVWLANIQEQMIFKLEDSAK